jgi:hypothetical protein
MDRRPRRETRGPRADTDAARPARIASPRQRWIRAPDSLPLRPPRRRARLIPRRPRETNFDNGRHARAATSPARRLPQSHAKRATPGSNLTALLPGAIQQRRAKPHRGVSRTRLATNSGAPAVDRRWSRSSPAQGEHRNRSRCPLEPATASTTNAIVRGLAHAFLAAPGPRPLRAPRADQREARISEGTEALSSGSRGSGVRMVRARARR